MGFQVVIRKDCEGCHPSFVERSPQVMRFESGMIVAQALPVEIFVPASALEGADKIGVALFGKNLLFLAPTSSFRITDLVPARQAISGGP